MRKGFTLVELSIVLVIVGLLIGGILVAKSMVETTKINSFVRQIQQYDIAVSNFKTRYNGLPGDTTIVGCNAPTGLCNNGLIDSYNGAGWTWSSAENTNFWPQLSRTQMLIDGYNYTNGSGQVFMLPNVHMPEWVIDKNWGVFAYGIILNGRNFYSVVKDSAYNGPIGNNGLPNILALSIDKKMDDGNGHTGIVFARTKGIIENINTVSSWCLVGATGEYDLKNVYAGGSNCVLRIDMLSQVGDSN